MVQGGMLTCYLLHGMCLPTSRLITFEQAHVPERVLVEYGFFERLTKGPRLPVREILLEGSSPADFMDHYLTSSQSLLDVVWGIASILLLWSLQAT